VAIDVRNLKPADLARLLNSTPLGTVLDERQLYRHRMRARFRIGDGRRVDLFRYVAWLVDQRHAPRKTSDPTAEYEAIKERAAARNRALSEAGRDIGELPAVVDPQRKAAAERNFRFFCEAYFPMTFYLGWSPDHLKVIARIEQAVLHGGLFALAMPRGSGKIGRAFAAGVCAVKINVVDETEEPRFAEIAGGTTANLEVNRRGSAGILWRVGGTGVQWAVIRFGKPIPLHVFPVNLSQTGGSQGDESYPASWTYNVYDIKSGALLESSVDPTSSPHKWKRPSIGQMIAADFGYAHYQDDGSGGEQLVLGWINEMVDQEACETSGSGSGG